MNKQLTSLISTITKAEGKKVSISIGNVREVMAILKKLCKDPATFQLVTRYLLGEK